MAANCGKSTSPDHSPETRQISKNELVSDNTVPLDRLHAIIDKMSIEAAPGEHIGKNKRKKSSAKEKEKEDFPEDFGLQEEETRDPEASTLVKEALITTGKLWARKQRSQDAEPNIDVRNSLLSKKSMKSYEKDTKPITQTKKLAKRRSTKKTRHDI
jgi:hypothetical protein